MRSGRRARATWLAVVTALAVLAPSAWAHSVKPEQVIASLRAPSLRESLGVVAVERSGGLPRLLVIAVDARWRQAAPQARRAAAEDWYQRWRRSAPQGIVAIVDAASRDSLVSFDGNGRASLKSGAANGEAAASQPADPSDPTE